LDTTSTFSSVIFSVKTIYWYNIRITWTWVWKILNFYENTWKCIKLSQTFYISIDLDHEAATCLLIQSF
jgi:hypothetical protein